MKEKRQYITDLGEIVSTEWTQIPDIPTRNYKTEYITDKGCKIPSHKSGVRMFRNVVWPSEMSQLDKGRFLELCLDYLIGDTGILGSASKGGPRAFDAIQIGEIIGLNPRRGQQWVKKMCRLRIFYKFKAADGSYQYWVNPVYAIQCGHRVSLSQFMVFRKEVSSLLTPWAVKKMNSMCAAEPVFKHEVIAEAERIMEVNR